MPESLWGKVLDFLTYKEIRCSRLVSRMFAKEIPQYVQHLHIHHSSELDVLSARPYSAVRFINVFCFITGEVEDPPQHQIHPDIFSRAIFFIQTFPKLESVFIGGMINGKRELYHSYDEDYDLYEFHVGDDFADCLNVLYSAIKSRALNADIRFRITHLYFPLHFQRHQNSREKLTKFLRSLGANVPDDNWTDEWDASTLPTDHPDR